MSLANTESVVRRLSQGAIGLVAFVAMSTAVTAATPPVIPPVGFQPVLASHKALYRVTLTSTRPGSDYQDVNGEMFLEFADTCDAWTTNQKSLLRVLNDEGTEELSRSVFAAWESKSGKNYRFSSSQTDNGQTTEYSGRASRNRTGEAGVVSYDKPDRKAYKLPPHFLFQTAQQAKLIEVAQKGEHFVSGAMFDGSEGGGAERFYAIILKPSVDKAQGTDKVDPLLDSPRHRIRVAFYASEGAGDDSGQDGDSNGDQPEYEMTMTVHENGVVSDYDYDYEDFSVHGQLESIQALPSPHC